MATDTSTAGDTVENQPFMVPLHPDVHQALRDESYELSRGGTKVHMTDIAREAITKRLAHRLAS